MLPARPMFWKKRWGSRCRQNRLEATVKPLYHGAAGSAQGVVIRLLCTSCPAASSSRKRDTMNSA
jgi:ribosomal protein L44E